MSKLSAQCDELRSMSESVGLAMPQAATLMMGAADTIDRFESENHKLRELVAEMMIAVHEYAEKAQSENAKLLDENVRLRSCLSDDADNARQIMAENATLRQQLADVTESMGRVEERCAELREQGARLFDKTLELGTENANLRDALKALVMGTYAELCTDRDQPQCRECSMRRGDDTCVTADAMELLGIDMYGESMGGIK